MISKLLIIIDQFPFVYFWENVGTTFSSINDFLEESNLLNFYHIYFIVHDIYSSFDCHSSLEVTGTFLDISKPFDRVCHEGLLYKKQSTGITGLRLELIF